MNDIIVDNNDYTLVNNTLRTLKVNNDYIVHSLINEVTNKLDILNTVNMGNGYLQYKFDGFTIDSNSNPKTIVTSGFLSNYTNYLNKNNQIVKTATNFSLKLDSTTFPLSLIFKFNEKRFKKIFLNIPGCDLRVYLGKKTEENNEIIWENIFYEYSLYPRKKIIYLDKFFRKNQVSDYYIKFEIINIQMGITYSGFTLFITEEYNKNLHYSDLVDQLVTFNSNYLKDNIKDKNNFLKVKFNNSKFLMNYSTGISNLFKSNVTPKILNLKRLDYSDIDNVILNPNSITESNLIPSFPPEKNVILNEEKTRNLFSDSKNFIKDRGISFLQYTNQRQTTFNFPCYLNYKINEKFIPMYLTYNCLRINSFQLRKPKFVNLSSSDSFEIEKFVGSISKNEIEFYVYFVFNTTELIHSEYNLARLNNYVLPNEYFKNSDGTENIFYTNNFSEIFNNYEYYSDEFYFIENFAKFLLSYEELHNFYFSLLEPGSYIEISKNKPSLQTHNVSKKLNKTNQKINFEFEEFSLIEEADINLDYFKIENNLDYYKKNNVSSMVSKVITNFEFEEFSLIEEVSEVIYTKKFKGIDPKINSENKSEKSKVKFRLYPNFYHSSVYNTQKEIDIEIVPSTNFTNKLDFRTNK